MKPILSNPSNNYEATLLLTNNDGWFNVSFSQIVYCSSHNGATRFHLTNGKTIVVPSAVKYYDRLLALHGFFRCHQSHLVNTMHLSCITRRDGGWGVIMNTMDIVPVARSKKGGLVEKLRLMNIGDVGFYPAFDLPVNANKITGIAQRDKNLKVHRN